MQNGGEIQDGSKKFQPFDFGKLDYLKKVIENRFKKNTKWPNNPRCCYPLNF
jgi:hypothetical protein